MDAVVSVYRDPLFLLFPVTTLLIGAAAFLVFALPLSWLAAGDPKRLSRWRLQKPPAPARRFFWPSLGRLAVNTACVLSLAAALWPLLRLTGVHGGGWPTWYEVLWQLPLFFIVDDGCYYFLHRALHRPWLFRRVHSVHHRIRTPAAVAGGYFHPVEYALISLVALIGPVLFGAHVVTLWIWAVLRQWLAADGHSGYALPWSPGRLIPGYQGAAFHDWHHRCCVGNYANMFIWLDRWFGTVSAGYGDRSYGRGGAA